MGIAVLLLGVLEKGGCCGTDTNEDRPQMNYDFLIKREKKKDGLDVYRPREVIYSSTKIRCPLCKCQLPKEDLLNIEKKLQEGGEYKLSDLIEKYNNEAKTKRKPADISALENIYKEIQAFYKLIEANRYFKHTCTRNNICKRENNQDVYIDLCVFSDEKEYEEILPIDIHKLKTDENYRNKYINDKKAEYEKYQKILRKEEIENKYRTEFEQYTFSKEKSKYDQTVSFTEFIYQGQLSKKPGEYGYDPNSLDLKAFSLFNGGIINLRYSGTKKRFKSFVEKLTRQRIENFYIFMESWEYEEFQEFISLREPEYLQLKDI